MDILSYKVSTKLGHSQTTSRPGHPNGFCGLPVQQSCPHANVCLTCPMFITTADFLPQHHSQRQETLQLIGDAETRGHARLAEMNQRVLISLDQIVATFQDNPGEPTEDTNAR